MSLEVRAGRRLSPRFRLDVSFTVSAGVTIVFGESGSGKTTLLRSVAGLTRPDSGRIVEGGRTLFDSSAGIDLPVGRRRIGLVFQHLALFPHLSARDNIAYGLSQQSAGDRPARVAAIAESFHIAHVLERRPGAISGGERQRVALARALVIDPAVLLLDEPLSSLDQIAASRIIADLRAWNAERRIPILYVTHSPREAFALGERVLLLRDGAIAADGTPADVLHAPASDSIAQLAGFENLLDVTVVERRPEAGVMLTRVNSTALDVEAPLTAAAAGDRMRLAIRAGDILVATELPRGLSARNVIAGTIRAVSRQGAVVRLQVDAGVPIEVHVTPTAAATLDLSTGRAVWLVVKTHSCHPVAAV